MRHIALAALVVLAGCGGPGGNDSPAATADMLIEADRAFARVTSEQRLDGWMSYFTEDAVRLLPGREVVRGLDEIRALDSGLFDDGTLSLEWEPAEAGLFRDHRHGFTSGRYELVRVENGGAPEIVGRGTYLTLWRREPSGWRVILDTGSPDPPAGATQAE